MACALVLLLFLLRLPIALGARSVATEAKNLQSRRAWDVVIREIESAYTDSCKLLVLVALHQSVFAESEWPSTRWELEPHQAHGLAFLAIVFASDIGGGILADEMGFGESWTETRKCNSSASARYIWSSTECLHTGMCGG